MVDQNVNNLGKCIHQTTYSLAAIKHTGLSDLK